MHFSGQIKQNEITFKILFLEVAQNLEGNFYSPIRTLEIKLFGKTIFKKANKTSLTY
jgi:hypothetical protein